MSRRKIGLARLRKLARITFEHEPDETPVRGNASAIDPATDRETERYIADELKRGNVWAWCVITVVAWYDGYEGRSVVGACSYKSEAEFKRYGYPDMVREALEELSRNLEAAS